MLRGIPLLMFSRFGPRVDYFGSGRLATFAPGTVRFSSATKSAAGISSPTVKYQRIGNR